MNVLNSAMFNLESIIVTAFFIIAGLVAWFFVNRASSRVRVQIALLEELLEQQKRQNALLRRLCDAQFSPSAAKQQIAYNNDVTIEDKPEEGLRIIAER